MGVVNSDFARKRRLENSSELKKLADLFPVEPINSREKSGDFPPPEKTAAATRCIIGLKVRPANSCKQCGCEFATIGPNDGKYYATLTCSCGCSRGSLTESTGKWIESVAAMFGAPATITLRRPPIPPVEAETVPSIDGANSNAMNRKGNHRGK